MHEIASFGRWLKLRRIALELTQADLARLVGCAEVTIRKIEADERRPSAQVAERLASNLELEPDEHVSFIKAARSEIGAIRLPAPTPDWAPADYRGYLPVPPTALIGRDRELALVCARLHSGVRLLTLTGPGGAGKTRLAIQSATTLRTQFAHGAWFVNLAPISDPTLVAGTIAQALEVRERAGLSLTVSLLNYLRPKELLLLIDNFEHVLAAAPLVAELLAAAPGLTVLATSRATLHLSGEHELVVAPLELPPMIDDRRPTTDDRIPRVVGRRSSAVMRYAAIQLFVERARAVRPDFVLTNENAPAVTEICVRVDGLPLAIELAAARSKLFEPLALLARLEHRLQMLTDGARDLPARQQTLRDAIAWSYDLLSADHQALFRQLAVFVGGCTQAAADAVIRTENRGLSEESTTSVLSPQSSVLDGLAALIDQSLLRQETINGEPRYTMLETIREYALERLAASGQAPATCERHALYFMALAEAAEPELLGSRQAEWFNRLEAERDNLRTALEWSLNNAQAEPSQGSSATSHVDQSSDRDQIALSLDVPTSPDPAEVGWRLAGALERFWDLCGPWSDGRMALTVASARAPSATVHQQAAHAKALKTAGMLGRSMCDLTIARTCLEESLVLYRALGDKPGIAAVLRSMGLLAWYAQDHHARNALLEESLALCRELNDKVSIAQVLSDLGLTAWSQGDFARATELHMESLALCRELNDKAGIAGALGNLGEVARWHGAYARAEALLEQSLALSRDLGDTSGSSVALLNLGHVALAQGEYTRAVALLEQSLLLAREVEARIIVAWALRSLGTVAHRQGDNARAAALHAQALALYWDNKDIWGITETLEGLAACGPTNATLAAQLLGAAAALRAQTGNPMAPLDREDVEQATTAARAALGDAAFTAAWDARRALPLEQVIAEALVDEGRRTKDESA